MSALPWDFIGPPKEGEAGVPNLPSPEGAELGRNHVRFYEQEEAKHPPSAPRCDGCAFRLGTLANQSVATQMTALKCVIEGEPFYCHKGVGDGEPKRLCAGYEVLRGGR